MQKVFLNKISLKNEIVIISLGIKVINYLHENAVFTLLYDKWKSEKLTTFKNEIFTY